MPKYTKLLCARCKKQLEATDSLALQETTITKTAAKRMGLIPLSSTIRAKKDYWILDGMIKDVKRLGGNYALVKESDGVALYHTTSISKDKIKR